MLPGEADAAQHLDAVLRVVHRVVQRQRGGGRGRQRMLGGRLVGGAGGAPGQGGGTFGPAGHGGAQVLDRLELTDRAAELPAGPGVVGGRAAAPGGHPGGFGRVQGRRQVADAFCAQAGQEVLRRDDRMASRTAASSREKSSGASLSTATPGWPASSRNHTSPSAPSSESGGRGEQVAGGPQDGAGLARHPQPAVRLAGPGQRAGGERDAGGGLGLRESRRSSSRPQRASRRLASAVGSTGPGARAQASCSSAAARSVTVPPSRGMAKTPRAARSLRSAVLAPWRTTATGVGALGPVAEGRLQGLLLLRHRDRHGLSSRSYSQN